MTPRELLINGAQELGLDLSTEQVNSIFVYLTELKKWNRKINLTAIREERDVIIKHALDSLSHIKGFVPRAGTRLLDMGSGAGFPAIPLKIALPEIMITMVESIKKKASFLRHVVRTLDLKETEVIDKRTEELKGSLGSTYDIVTARAFADMKAALLSGMPFLKSGGVMVLSRGPEETITEGDLSRVGAVLEKRVELTLPHSDYKRAIWVFRHID
ncbi:MAG TPA: 16S rRNA (guanine(527)-N(7))-methyltransferase RsmG [Nitrospirota bacterium]